MRKQVHCNLNKKYFEDIDSKEKAYWLGFLYADGYVTKNNYALALELADKDEELLVRFCNHIGANDKSIKKIIRGKYISCRVLVSSKEFVSHIINKGCVNKKSLIVRLPEFNDDKLNLSFLMGYFDGDGDSTSTALYSGSKFFLEDIKKKYSIESEVKMKRTVYFLMLGADLKRLMMSNYEDSLKRKRRTYINDKGLKTEDSNYHKRDKVEKRVFEVSKEELKTLIENNSLVKIGKMFGVSDNAIRKRAKRMGIL